MEPHRRLKSEWWEQEPRCAGSHLLRPPRVLVNPGAMTPPCGRTCGLRVDLPCGREAGFVFNSANPSPPPPGLSETLPPAGSSHGLKEALAGSQHISTSPALTAGGRLSPSPSTPPCHSLHPLSFTFRSAGRLRASVPCSLCQECSLQSYPRPHLLITQVSAPSPAPSPPPRDHVHHQHLPSEAPSLSASVPYPRPAERDF